MYIFEVTTFLTKHIFDVILCIGNQYSVGMGLLLPTWLFQLHVCIGRMYPESVSEMTSHSGQTWRSMINHKNNMHIFSYFNIKVLLKCVLQGSKYNNLAFFNLAFINLSDQKCSFIPHMFSMKACLDHFPSVFFAVFFFC